MSHDDDDIGVISFPESRGDTIFISWNLVTIVQTLKLY